MNHRWVFFVSGLAYITVPGHPNQTAYLSGGEFGLIFAADTNEVSSTGHRSQYPGNAETVALASPTENNTIPNHIILHMGPCEADEVSGLRSKS